MVKLRSIVNVTGVFLNLALKSRSDQLFKSNHTFCVFLICSLKNQSFLREWFISCLNLTSLFALFVFLICSLKNQCF
jgi:hypothetical protein